MFNLPWSLRVWSGSQPKSLTIADTEVGGLVRWWGTLLTNLAALCWTISSCSTYFCWYGSRIQEQYSSLGRIVASYDFSFNCCSEIAKENLASDLQLHWFYRCVCSIRVCCSSSVVTPRYTHSCQWDRLVLHPWSTDNEFCCLLHWWWK